VYWRRRGAGEEDVRRRPVRVAEEGTDVKAAAEGSAMAGARSQGEEGSAQTNPRDSPAEGPREKTCEITEGEPKSKLRPSAAVDEE
jgi:hypothetical protein